MKKGKIIVISGPSGVGKTTLYRKILDKYQESIAFSVSATTRPQRSGEKEGKDYFFISKDEFKNKIENNELVEWAIVYKNLYGTLKSEVERIINSGKNCLLDVDVQGGMNIKRIFPESSLIFISPPSINELKKRIKKRKSESLGSIHTRMENAVSEMNYSDKYDYIIINNILEKAYDDLETLIMKIIN